MFGEEDDDDVEFDDVEIDDVILFLFFYFAKLLTYKFFRFNQFLSWIPL
jgi:hypothetical protein